MKKLKERFFVRYPKYIEKGGKYYLKCLDDNFEYIYEEIYEPEKGIDLEIYHWDSEENNYERTTKKITFADIKKYIKRNRKQAVKK